MMGPLIRMGFAALVGATLLSSCGSTEDAQENNLSYDPSLEPSQIFFNPQAKWVKKWEKTPPPLVPKEAPAPSKEESAFQEKAKEIPWAVVKQDGKVEELPQGVQPAEVLVPSPEEVQKKIEALNQKMKKRALVARAPAATAPVSASIEQAPQERLAPAPTRISGPIEVKTEFPLQNSLAVDSPRYEEYRKLSGYNWEVPVAAQQAFETQNALMNSFFFVRRRGETWKNLSYMIYGTTERAADLQKWNANKSLKVGTILYYASPNRPQDEKMMPIAKDFGQPFETVHTVEGEPLSLLGKRIYGEWRTWKEISYFNSIDNPHRVQAGTELTIQPRLLGHQQRRSRANGLRAPASLGSKKVRKKGRTQRRRTRSH